MIIPVILGLIGVGTAFLYKDKILKIAKPKLSSKHLPSQIYTKVVMDPNERNQQVEPATLKLPDTWIEVELDGEIWEVSSDYIAPVGIGEAQRLANEANAELPTPKLVDAIWKAADLKLEPRAMSHDGTLKMMNSKGLVADHEAIIQKQIEQLGNPDFKLVAGHYKDVVAKGGKRYLYGWHVANDKAAEFTKKRGIPLEPTVTPGLARVIQGENPGRHDDAWKDYSQGARLVRRVNRNA